MRHHNNSNVILIADDDFFIRRIISQALQGSTKIVEVSDGADVEEVYKQCKPDMIFLDIHMPHMSGEKLVNKILDTDPDAHIIMLSADSSKKNVMSTIKKGAKNFLRKPFSRERLLRIFHDCPTIT